jgi:ATP-dependent RNA helicase CshB
LRLFQEKYITHQVQTVVFDEVDMTLDLGFFNHINQLMSIIDYPQLQKIACSATTHDSLANQLKKYFANTKVISETNTIWSNQLVSHNLVYTSDFVNPNKTLLGLLKIIKPFCCLIFANTIKDSQMLYELLIQNQYNACLINKDISSRERKRLFNEINKSKYQYVVCTDLLSRGVDIVAIDTVINYGLPNDDIWYMHRIGRTGRNNKPGTSYTIYTQNIDNIINRLSHKKIN